jgi:hypothetical protein
MIIATTALLLTLPSGATVQAQEPAGARDAVERQHATTGLVISADVDGRVAIYDTEGRLVFELDKPAGRQIQIALEPGAYEARLAGRGEQRARFQIHEGRLQLLGSASFEALPDAPGPATSSRQDGPRDGRHRIEVRFGGWADGSYDSHGASWNYEGSAHGAFGLEYLGFIRNDIGIGVALTSLVRADGSGDWDEVCAARSVTGIPLVVRWYPVRRFTAFRSVEPYVTAGAGPVFGVDTTATFDHERHGYYDSHASTRVGTTFGGRVGGGVDFRLGQTFTMGMAGAWNWDAGFSDDLWRAPRPNGGEFTVSFGWNFGK